jgi:ribonucleoside-diphosphate reductase alpha chain
MSVTDSWQRVASALASVESNRYLWQRRFYNAMKDYRFIPGGRILAGAGTGHKVSLFNCFVMGKIEDSIDGIFEHLKQAALTMQQGGGVGYDFSTLRPSGTQVKHVQRTASGPVSFMRIWDSMCQTLISSGPRRGAMMATLRCDHPDIEIFINAKRDRHELRNFNLSVLVTDDFIQAVQEDKTWQLVFPEDRITIQKNGKQKDLVRRQWSAYGRPIPCRVFHTLKARALWDQIIRASYETAEPGVIFIDRINNMNNLWYKENISATNPCGEIPLPEYGVCDLGSINLTRFVKEPFSSSSSLDMEGIKKIVPIAVRMLDNVVDVSRFPLVIQKRRARKTRRIGLGLTGLADALIMLGLRYGEDKSYTVASDIMRTISHTAYRASIKLAREKGPFPSLQKDKYLMGRFIQSLPTDIKKQINLHGIRNSHLTAIAPTGTISLLAGNVSSGVEPVFAFKHKRYILEGQSRNVYHLEDYAWRMWKESVKEKPPTRIFVSARELEPEIHLRMQAALQAHVDNSISKTINIPVDYDFESFRSVYETAYELGLKSCTVFRPNPERGEVLGTSEKLVTDEHCCNINL